MDDLHCCPESIAASSKTCISRFSSIPRVCLEGEKQSLVDVANLYHLPKDCEAKYKSLSDPQDLQAYLRNPFEQHFTTRILFLRQAHSWSSIQVSQSMLDSIVREYEILPQFLDLCSCFHDRDEQTEEGFCSPVLSRHSTSSYEICYAYRYVEKKSQKSGHPWRIRQSGLYHRYDFTTRRSTFIVISPMANSRFEKSLIELLDRSPTKKSEILENPMLVHHMLISTHLPDVRGYLLYFEEVLEPIWRTATTSLIDEPLRFNCNNLSQIRYLESRFLPLGPVLSGVTQITQGLKVMEKVLSEKNCLTGSMNVVLETSLLNFAHEASAYKENTLYLIQRTKNTGQIISDILNLKNQATAQQQNRYMSTLAGSTRDDSVNVRVITLVTLFYLPFSFIATILGMNLFSFETGSRRLMVSSQFWIFFCLAIPLTALTLIFWKWKTWKHNRKHGIPTGGNGTEWELCEV